MSRASHRAEAVALLEYACGGAAGRAESDPVYQAVTEGRDRGAAQKGYSSCGDLAHWMLYRLGVRLPLVNRAEHLGWITGVNVGRLAFSKLAVKQPGPDARFEPGDIAIIWSRADGTDAHVMVVLEDRQPGAMRVAEYGQPGGHVRSRPIARVGGLLSIGTRALHRVLPLDYVLDAAQAAGQLEPTETARAWAERLGLERPASEADTDRAPPPAPESDGPPKLDPRELPILRLGSTGPAVRLLQEQLNLKAQRRRLVPDGVFGHVTQAEVKAFQKSRGLSPDGEVGAVTWQEVLR